jgi:hypothetical protein
MRKIIVMSFCLFAFVGVSYAAKAPKHLRVPKECKVVRANHDQGVYKLSCSSILPKKIRGWKFSWEEKFGGELRREWNLKSDPMWIMVEYSECKQGKCTPVEVHIIEELGC